MKFHFISDLHTEFSPYKEPFPKADLYVLGGDIAIDPTTVPRPPGRGIWLAGNHEYFHCDYDVVNTRNKAYWEGLSEAYTWVDMHHKEIVDDVLFLMTPLFTNCDGRENMSEISLRINDFYHITIKDEISGLPRLLYPTDWEKMFNQAMAWLHRELAQGKDYRKVVVVTHWSPGINAPYFKRNLITPYFCPDVLDLFLTYKIDYWYFGHTHHCQDEVYHGTRAIANARGYVKKNGKANRQFKPQQVWEI